MKKKYNKKSLLPTVQASEYATLFSFIINNIYIYVDIRKL